MRTLSIITLLATLVLPTVAFAEMQTISATHTYILGDHDSKDDARQRCLLEAKRKILEQAGVYIESASEVKNFDLTNDKITSFATAVLRVEDTTEEVGFQQGHMTMTLTLKANVDLAEVRKQLAARQVDASVRDTVVAQQERLKRLEAQLEAMMQRRQGGQPSGHAPASTPFDISAEDLQAWHTQAAQGDATAQLKLGMIYHFGNGVPQDYVKARQWYEKAVAQGDARAQVNLGWMYAQGQGVPQDYAKARRWYEKAAAQREVAAQVSLGLMYAYGEGVPQDYGKARRWYEEAAVQGDVQAQLNLGVLYSKGGHGVPQDYGKARQWNELAAVQGDMRAQYNLGLLYDMGRGVPQNYVTARQWYEQAAAQGEWGAQHNLGVLYANGQGVPKDDVRAYMWYSLAAAQLMGNEQKFAGGNRDKVAGRMTSAQIAEAQRLSQQCQTKQFKDC